MALVLKDRVRESSSTSGTGTITLAGAATGFDSFASIGDGNTTYYAIIDTIAGDWEVGLGTYTASGTTLSRDTVLESSNSDTLVNFAANSKDVICTYPADKSVFLAADGSLSLPGALSATGAVTGSNLNVSNWDTAYGWGDHSTVGYLTSYTETDPVYTASSWYTTTNNSSNWDTAYGWGDHASAGYLTSETYTGTVTSVAATVPTGFTVTGSPVTTTGTLAIAFDTGYSLPTTASQTNWDTAYGWGDHASAGYVIADGAVVINESGADVDFRIESDTNANAFFLEGSSGDVGIGTSTVDSALHIEVPNPLVTLEDSTNALKATVNGENGNLVLSADTANASGSASYIGFEVDTSEAMRIDSSGDVGIGTDAPSSILHARATTPVLTVDGSAFSSSSNGTGFGIYRSAAGRTAGYTWTIENDISSGGSSASHYQTDDLLFKSRVNVTDTTLTEQMRITSSGGVSFGSSGTAYGTSGQVLTSNGNAAPSWQNASGGAGTLEAWVNFNGTGTVAIREDGNVSSITDNGTGRYQINFSTALTDTNYAVCGLAGRSISNNNVVGLGGSPQNVSMLTTSCRIITTNIGGSSADMDYITVAVFR